MFRVNGLVLLLGCLITSIVGVRDWVVVGFNGQLVSLYEGVKDGNGEYCLRVIEVIVLAESVWIWNFSIVLRCAPFLWQCTIFMILFMGPNEWAFSMRCCAKLEVVLWLCHAVYVLCSGWRTVFLFVWHTPHSTRTI